MFKNDNNLAWFLLTIPVTKGNIRDENILKS